MRLLLTATATPSDFRQGLRDDARSPLRDARSTAALHAGLWIIAIFLAFMLDRPLAIWLRDSGIAEHVRSSGIIKDAAKFAGYFWFPLAIAFALLIWHPLRWRGAVFMLLCLMVGASNSVLKWLIGRYRPFKLPPYDVPQPFRISPFNGGLAGLFHQANDLCFVSGHTALVFSAAAGVSVLLPKNRAIVKLVYALATIVLLERVGENAHWLSDAVCAAALGIWGAALLARCCRGNLLPAKN